MNSLNRLVVVAPHPDDEVLGCAGSILQELEKNISVSVFYLTNGDANRAGVYLDNHRFFPTASQYVLYGQMRQKEAAQALSILGVAAQDSYFFGLPDLGLHVLQRPTFTHTYCSRFTKAQAVPYDDAVQPHLPYTREAALSAIRSLLSELQPTQLLLPSPADSHSDHRACTALLLEAITQSGISPEVYAYPIHSPHWPKPAGNTITLPLLAPTFRQSEWQNVPLTTAQTRQKLEALQAYASQFRVPLLGKLLYSLVRSNELLLPLRI